MIHLVADVLDEQLLDANSESAGRADGIVLQLREGKPPLVAYIEVGPITLLARFSRRVARWYAKLDRRLGPGRGTPYRIPWTRIHQADRALRMDLVIDATPINAGENWLRTRIIRRIPGS
jgi:hypothetical protein